MGLSRHDVRLAARSFARHRGFTTVAVLSLALAIALNTTIYSVIDAMVNPKIDIRDPDRIYWLTVWGDYRHKVDNPTRAALLRSGFHSHEELTSYDYRSGMGQGAAVEYGRRYREATFAYVAPRFFSVLGVRPVAGRVFADDD